MILCKKQKEWYIHTRLICAEKEREREWSIPNYNGPVYKLYCKWKVLENEKEK